MNPDPSEDLQSLREWQKTANPDPSEHLKSLHALYCQLTGNELRWSYEAEQIWFSWRHAGNKEDDMTVTVAYLKRLYQKRPEILAACLRLRRLIGDTINFEQYLAEAKKVVREKEKRTNRDKILEATGRPKEEKPNERSADDVLARLHESEEWKKFVKFKETL